MDTSKPEGGGSKQGLIALNDLTYVLEPDMSVAVNKTHKRHFFQSNTYVPQQRGICILNSGADYIDTRRSFLSFECKLSPSAGALTHGFFGTGGSACNLIESILISTRSGDELCRITDFGLLQNMMIPLTYCNSWTQTTGQLMGLGGGVLDSRGLVHKDKYGANGQRFLIPMYLLAPLFGYGRLLPAMLMSCMRIEITWAPTAKAFKGHAATDGASADVGAVPYTIENLYFDLASVQLSDSIQRALNEQSATNGLEIVYTDYEKTEVNHGQLSDVFHCEVRKSCSRALKAFARIRCKSTGVAEGSMDSFKAESVWPVIEYQWQLGSLYFPQQPIKASDPTKPFTCAAESYAHLLESVDKFHPGSKPPALTFRGKLEKMASSFGQAGEFAAGVDAIRVPKTLVGVTVPGVAAAVDFPGVAATVLREDQSLPLALNGFEATKGVFTDYGHVGDDNMMVPRCDSAMVGSFANDQHTIGVTLERSTMFNLAGVPVNNSRVLALRVKMKAETSEWKVSKDPNIATDHSEGTRSLSVYLKYVKLARVFLNNVEVEQ